MNTSNLCISYLDESKINYHHRHHYSIASMTASKQDYVENIEVEWKKFRDKYNIPEGQIMHFTDIKQLLNTNNTNTYKPQWVTVFKQKDKDEIDYEIVYNFFNDLIQTINQLPFVVQITGIKTDPKHSIRKQSRDFTKSTYYPAYIAFKEHLNLMSTYLLGLHSDTYSQYVKSNKKSTKLRYDGDVDLNERDDLKEAYHHCITLGTKHFRPAIVKNLFDEIRFIGKNEVAQDDIITHAGNEIIDFIATIAARNLWGIERSKIKIKVPGYDNELDPLPVIINKIVNHQKVEDISF